MPNSSHKDTPVLSKAGLPLGVAQHPNFLVLAAQGEGRARPRSRPRRDSGFVGPRAVTAEAAQPAHWEGGRLAACTAAALGWSKSPVATAAVLGPRARSAVLRGIPWRGCRQSPQSFRSLCWETMTPIRPLMQSPAPSLHHCTPPLYPEGKAGGEI